ncbi:MAG: hypothetical protein OXG25_06030 [Gammaproteobacteria bacterium]|nr:hypothetical protein [Gammaproteobacteria bacterium]MCY4094767.1 hypothetical protein [Gammaproteobacteria bacterium]
MNDDNPKSHSQSDVRKVLDMLHDGKVTVDEAEQLLGALSSDESPVYQVESADSELPKFLVVQISSGTDEVNVRVPVKLISLGVDLSKLNPQVAEALNEAVPGTLNGLAGLKDNELRQALQGLSINIHDDEDSVRVYCE